MIWIELIAGHLEDEFLTWIRPSKIYFYVVYLQGGYNNYSVDAGYGYYMVRGISTGELLVSNILHI